LLDDIQKIRRFGKADESIEITEIEQCDNDYIELNLSQIQNFHAISSDREGNIVLAFDSEGFKIAIRTPILNALEVHEVAKMLGKREKEKTGA